MKKLLTKLLSFTLISLILSTGMIAFAEEDDLLKNIGTGINRGLQETINAVSNPNQAIDELYNSHAFYELYNSYTSAEVQPIVEDIKALEKKSPCVSEEEINAGRIVTYLEEPLYIQESVSEANQEERPVTYRICYRHTFQYFQKNLKSGAPQLTTFPYVTGPQKNEDGCSQIAQNFVSERAGQKGAPRYSCKEIQVIISSIAGTKYLYGYIGLIYRWAASIVGLISVLIIVISGIQISASGGSADAAGAAKTRIVQSISGLALLFLSGLLLNVINPNFFVR